MLGESEHWMLELKLIQVCVKPPPPQEDRQESKERDSSERQTLSSSPAQGSSLIKHTSS